MTLGQLDQSLVGREAYGGPVRAPRQATRPGRLPAARPATQASRWRRQRAPARGSTSPGREQRPLGQVSALGRGPGCSTRRAAVGPCRSDRCRRGSAVGWRHQAAGRGRPRPIVATRPCRRRPPHPAAGCQVAPSDTSQARDTGSKAGDAAEPGHDPGASPSTTSNHSTSRPTGAAGASTSPSSAEPSRTEKSSKGSVPTEVEGHPVDPGSRARPRRDRRRAAHPRARRPRSPPARHPPRPPAAILRGPAPEPAVVVACRTTVERGRRPGWHAEQGQERRSVGRRYAVDAVGGPAQPPEARAQAA